ncbi:MAG TPA: HlyD family efflux transporter periplasmic adaptor subunit [Rhodopila sp.]|nr:HlyD family efflux transporter periplasmic adaptor subunit [Rhodopila sp.]
MSMLKRAQTQRAAAVADGGPVVPAQGQVPATRPLFRQEVVAFQQSNRQWGRVVPLQPLPTRAAVWFTMLVAAAIVAFLCFAHYARKQVAAGYLTPAGGSARVFAAQAGVVGSVFVHQGDTVTQGQPLFSVLTSQIAGNGQDVNAAMLASLQDQVQALKRRISEEIARADSEKLRLTAQITEHEAVIGQYRGQMTIQKERLALNAKSVEAGLRLRPQGLISDVDERRREELVLEQQQALINLQQQITTRQGQLSEVQFNLKQLPFTLAEKVQALRNQLAAAEQKIAEVNGRSAYVVRAPVGGRVSLVEATVGQVVDPRRLQMEILPSDGVLQAKLFIPVSAIGFIEVGQDVRLLFDAFPYQRFGTQHGKIVDLSRSVLLPNDADTPIAFKEPVYTATVKLDRSDILANGKHIPLMADMSLRADIILERRTLVDWILAPLHHLRLDG